jgi:hypothetical protein
MLECQKIMGKMLCEHFAKRPDIVGDESFILKCMNAYTTYFRPPYGTIDKIQTENKYILDRQNEIAFANPLYMMKIAAIVPSTDLILECVRLHGSSLRYVDSTFSFDGYERRTLLEQTLKMYPASFRYLNQKYREDKELIAIVTSPYSGLVIGSTWFRKVNIHDVSFHFQ